MPNATEVGRVLAFDVAKAEYVIQHDNVIEPAFQNIRIRSGLIYVHGGDLNGVLQEADEDTYLGRTSKHLTELRTVGEQNTPVLIPETGLSEPQKALMFVRGAAGTKLLLLYQAA